jgi:hypothetical protein
MADAEGLNPSDFKRSYGFESRPGHCWGSSDAVDGNSAIDLIQPFAVLSEGSLSMTASNFTRLCCGRNSARPTDVVISGDEALAQRFLGAMSITP